MRNVVSLLLVMGALSACDDSSQIASGTDMGVSDMGPMMLPDGACLENTDCGQDQYCRWTFEHACGRDQSLGACTNFHPERGCVGSLYWVCGCDGFSYSSQCLTDVSYGVSVDYGGLCREGTLVACQLSSDCPDVDDEIGSRQFCVDDPRDNCIPNGATACPGVCVHGNPSDTCGSTSRCDSATVNSKNVSPGTEACIALAEFCSPSDPTCDKGQCVFTTGLSCESQSDCESPALCMPLLGCDPSTGAPCRACVRL